MTTVDRVKAMCKQKKIPLYKLEKECGFANGYIGQLKKGAIPDNRLGIIAEYLGVSISALLGISETSESDEFMALAMADKEFLRHAKMLFNLPEERRRFLYEIIESQMTKPDSVVASA